MVALMKASGLDVTVDPAGNIIGKRAGKNQGKPLRNLCRSQF